jgi:glycosyltransferase involved in cell wall biosynthesis
MLVGWIVQSPGARIASTRYRALYPALAIQQFGHKSRVYTNSLQAFNDLKDLDAIVFVKRLDQDALRLVDAAALLDKGIFVDLCDNTIIIEYERQPSQLQRIWLGAASALVDAVVVTTEAMTRAVSPAFFPGTRFETIPDQIETTESYRAAEAFLGVNMVKPPKSSVAKSGLRILKFFLLAPGHTSRVAAKRLQQIFLRKKNAFLPRKVVPVSDAVPSIDRPVLLWFGNHGSPHSNFGMLSLLEVAPALEKLARELDFELWVISNDRKKYESGIAPLQIHSRYFEWAPSVVFSALKTAKVCLFPSTGDCFSETKSANRVVMALQHGVPAIVSPLESLEPLRDALLFEDWEHNVRQILTDTKISEQCLDKAKPILEAVYSADAIGRQWDALLRGPHRSKAARGDPDGRIKAGVLLDLVQDLDVLRPLIAAWRKDPRFELRVLVSDIGLARSPRMVRTFLELAVIPIVVERELALQGNDQSVRGLDVLISASETSARAHRFNHQLTLAANADGVRTYTLQHGLENIGLTYFDEVTGPDVTFASDRVLVWTAPDNFPEWTPVQTRNKAFAVGRSAQIIRVDVDFPELSGRKVVGVFENLHWDRYTQSYRNKFVQDLLETAAALPELLFLLKPHHAGKYLARPGRLEGYGNNVILADPNDPKWEPYTAAAVIPHCTCVITTPSTVALDAAELGVPVAMVAYGLQLDVYRPLVQIQNAADWLAFIHSSQAEPGDVLDKNDAFRRRTRLDGDCIPRVTDLVVADMAAVGVTKTSKRRQF